MVKLALLLATLGSEPQVVTACLDLLLQQGEQIAQVVICHTAGADQPQSRSEPIARALAALQQEFLSSTAPARFVPIVDEAGQPLTDVDTYPAAQAAFRFLYNQVRLAKQAGFRLHFCIAGGRKTLAIFGMAAAQLLFDEDDRLWHLYSAGEFLESKRLHPVPGDQARLVPIPLILWSQISPALGDFADEEDPYRLAERLNALRLAERIESCRGFVLGALTPAEARAVALLVRHGWSDQEIAAELGLSARTVEMHLRSAYQKAAAHWEMESVNRAQLIALLSLYYAMQIPEKPA